MNGLSPRPINKKRMPPISSHFHATNKMASRIKDGIRCIMKSPSCSWMLRPGPKASAANTLTKRIARIQMIQGIQWNNLIVVFICLFFQLLLINFESVFIAYCQGLKILYLYWKNCLVLVNLFTWICKNTFKCWAIKAMIIWTFVNNNWQRTRDKRYILLFLTAKSQ